MRHILLLLLTATSILSKAQQIRGVAKDETNLPLNGATVSLIRALESSTVKLAVTKTDGSYNFSGIKEGNYKVLVTHVGYKREISPTFLLSTTDVTVPEFKLSKSIGN